MRSHRVDLTSGHPGAGKHAACTRVKVGSSSGESFAFCAANTQRGAWNLRNPISQFAGHRNFKVQHFILHA